MKTKWLGLSILLSAILLSGAIVFSALAGRYEFISGARFDKLTGAVDTSSGGVWVPYAQDK